MAIAVDASSPATATSTSTTVATVTTSSFTPPAGSVLVIGWGGNTGAAEAPPAPTITDSLGAHLTYTLVNFRSRGDGTSAAGQAAGWVAPVGSSAAMTVTITTGTASGNRQQAVKIDVLTGVDVAAILGATGENSASTSGALSQAVTGTAAGSLAYVVWNDWQVASTTFTAGTGCTVSGSSTCGGNNNIALVRRTSPDGTNGGSQTVAMTAPSSNARNWVWFEVLPASTSTVLPQQPRLPQAVFRAANY